MVKIAISSCLEYSTKTIPFLLKSLENSGFDLNEVHVFEGGNQIESVETINGVTLHKVTHNSFDLTSLITICENKIESDYWLLMHDTCKVGKQFCNKLYSANLTYKKIALKPFPSMSIGLYEYNYLIKHSDLIYTVKNNSYETQEELKNAKRKAIETEDMLLWKLRDVPCGVFGHERFEQPIDSDWSGVSTNRIQEYFPQLDLYKLKGNYGQLESVVTL